MTLKKNINITKTRLIVYNVGLNDSMVVQCNITNNHGYNHTNAYLNVVNVADNSEQQ